MAGLRLVGSILPGRSFICRWFLDDIAGSAFYDRSGGLRPGDLTIGRLGIDRLTAGRLGIDRAACLANCYFTMFSDLFDGMFASFRRVIIRAWQRALDAVPGRRRSLCPFGAGNGTAFMLLDRLWPGGLHVGPLHVGPVHVGPVVTWFRQSPEEFAS